MSFCVRRAVLSLFLLAALSPLAIGCSGDGFSADRAYSLCARILSFGPRPSGSDSLEKVRGLISGELRGSGLEPSFDYFTMETPEGAVRFCNVSAVKTGRGGRGRKRIIVAAHYESKLFRNFRFEGANDNASGTAVLLELSRVLSKRGLSSDVEFLFLDGEEAFGAWSESDSLYGSRRRASLISSPDSVRAFVLLDMIGERDVRIDFDGFSDPALLAKLDEAARLTGNESALSGRMIHVEDDHLPFAALGIPSIDVIDFSFPEWHTEGDSLGVISAESLGRSGEIVLRLLELVDGA